MFSHLNTSVSCICWDYTSLFYFIFLNPRANKIKGVLKLKYKGYTENNFVSTFYTKLNQHSQKIISDINMSPMFYYL